MAGQEPKYALFERKDPENVKAEQGFMARITYANRVSTDGRVRRAHLEEIKRDLSLRYDGGPVRKYVESFIPAKKKNGALAAALATAWPLAAVAFPLMVVTGVPMVAVGMIAASAVAFLGVRRYGTLWAGRARLRQEMGSVRHALVMQRLHRRVDKDMRWADRATALQGKLGRAFRKSAETALEMEGGAGDVIDPQPLKKRKPKRGAEERARQNEWRQEKERGWEAARAWEQEEIARRMPQDTSRRPISGSCEL